MADAFVEPSAEEAGAVRLPRVKLMVVRGETRCLERAVTAPAFLIGAAADCDLVLASQEIPPVHSYLFRSEGNCQIRSLGFEPALLVNGEQVETALLKDGDSIRVGDFELLLRELSNVAPLPKSFAPELEGKNPTEQSADEEAARRVVSRLVEDVRVYLLHSSHGAGGLGGAGLIRGPHRVTRDRGSSQLPNPLSTPSEPELRARQLHREDRPHAERDLSWTPIELSNKNLVKKKPAEEIAQKTEQDLTAITGSTKAPLPSAPATVERGTARERSLEEKQAPPEAIRVMRAEPAPPLQSPLGKPPKFLRLRDHLAQQSKRLQPQLRLVNTKNIESGDASTSKDIDKSP